jgi:hypothetical protein
MAALCGVRSTIALLFIVVTVLLTSLTDVAAQPVGPASQPSQPSKKVVVDARDRETASDLARRGGTLLVDYGAFALQSVPESQAALVPNRAGTVVRDHLDRIGLRGGRSIDILPNARTSSASTPQPRQGGGQLWLVQFVGPIKPDWLDDLRKAGLDPVMYMPQNGYLVWGDGAALGRLDALAQTSPVIQFSGPYDLSYRLAPALQASNQPPGTVGVTVQPYTSSDVDQWLRRLKALGGKVYREPSRVGRPTSISLDLPTGQLQTVAGWPSVVNVAPWRQPHLRDEAQGQIVAGNLTTSGSNPVPVLGASAYLAWTDAPGSTTSASYVNDLDLEVTIGGNTYKGKVFGDQYSTTGGAFDPRDNVESVLLPAGTTGDYTIRVIARNIAGDGVPGNDSALDQDFALVVTNGDLSGSGTATPTSTPTPTPTSSATPMATATPAGAPLAASYVSSPPTSWLPDQIQTYTITVTNTGTQVWSATGTNRVRLGVHFGGTSDACCSWATDQRFELPGDIAPGASYQTTVNITAPTMAGPYVLRHQMVKERVAWFDQIQKTNVSVAGGP